MCSAIFLRITDIGSTAPGVPRKFAGAAGAGAAVAFSATGGGATLGGAAAGAALARSTNRRMSSLLTLPPAPLPGTRPTHARKQFPIYKMTSNEWRAVVVSLLGFQVLFDIYSSQAFLSGFKNVLLLQIGVGLIAFGILVHLYRIGAE